PPRFGRKVHAMQADVSRGEDVARFVDGAAAALGRLDALVVNAGGPPPGKFADLDDAKWQAAFELTVMSAVRAVRAALPHLRAAGGGSIVAIQSTSIRQPIDNLLLSNALRMSIAGLFKTLATQRPLALARAQAAESRRPLDAVLAERASSIPTGRLGEPGEIGDAVAFLASPRASYITGVALQVDGGIVRVPL